MPYQPRDERELQDAMCWPAGVYDFEVVNAEVKESKSGNMMLALSLKIFDPNSDKTRQVKDWLVESDAPGCLMKLRHYCATVGDLAAYDSGSVENYPGIGACGKLKLGIQRSEDYPPQNKVADYVKPKEEVEEKPQSYGVPRSQAERANKAFQESGAPDDECPF